MDAPALMRLLGDDTRLRLLRALCKESLNVSELTAVLGLAQSGVSRHLGLLRDAGMVAEERSGGYAWFRLAPGLDAPDSPRVALWTWLKQQFALSSPATRADDSRLEEVRRLRKESFRQHDGAEAGRQLVPGRSWAAWSRALGLLLPPLDVADLGCGEGYLTIETAQWARHVVAIDQSPDVLSRGRAMARRRKVRNITWKRGAIEKLPLSDGCVDLVLLSQALHHAEEPAVVMAEAMRVLRPLGRVLLLDLREHDEAWVAKTLGDRWQGFSRKTLTTLLGEAGFADIAVRLGASRAGDPFAVLVARGTVPETHGRAPRSSHRAQSGD